MKANKNTIFDQVNQIKKGNIQYYSTLPLEERKKIVPFLLLKWLSCSNSSMFLQMLDQYANQYTFALYKHPELLWKIMSTVGSIAGERERIKWIYPKVDKGLEKSIDVVRRYFECTASEARTIIEVEGKDSVIEMAKLLGYQDAELKPIMKELK